MTKDYGIARIDQDGERQWWIFAPIGAIVEGGWTYYKDEASRMEKDAAELWRRRVGGEVVLLEESR